MFVKLLGPHDSRNQSRSLFLTWNSTLFASVGIVFSLRRASKLILPIKTLIKALLKFKLCRKVAESNDGTGRRLQFISSSRHRHVKRKKQKWLKWFTTLSQLNTVYYELFFCTLNRQEVLSSRGKCWIMFINSFFLLFLVLLAPRENNGSLFQVENEWETLDVMEE